MKRDAFRPTKLKALQVRRQGVASKRPDEAGRRKFRFCFPILRYDRVSFSKFSNRYALISGAARFLALFLVLTPCSPPVRSTNLHEASSNFVLVRTNSNYSSWQIHCRGQSSTETLFPIKKFE